MVNTLLSWAQWSEFWSSDLLITVLLISFVGCIALAYGFRVWFKGKAHYDRVDKQGGSPLLSKELMEGAYWFLQPVGRVLVSLGVTPNQISTASLVLGLVAGVSLAYGHFGSGAAFAIVSALLDAVDGMVARLSGQASDAGEVYDAAVDRYTEFFFLGGLAIYYRHIPVLLVITLFALLGSYMISYSTAKAEALHISPPKGSMRRPERALYLILGAALSPITITWFEALRETPIPIGHPMVIAVTLVAVLSNLSAVERFHAIYETMKQRDWEAAQAKAIANATASETESESLEEAPSTTDLK